MARVCLQINHIPLRMTIKAMLEAVGHQIVRDLADVLITDSPTAAVKNAPLQPTLLLASAPEIPAAVHSMRLGVYGYIFVPLQPGEAPMMVERALCRAEGKSAAKPAEPETIENAETQHILQVLRQCNYNRTEAAEQLGIGRNTLWRKLNKIRSHPE